MEVKVLSKETIKPSSSSSTPQHPTTFNLTILDQIAPEFYVPIVLFYSNPTPSHQNTNTNIPEISHHLKKSFSETLTKFYPLAGRMRDDLTCVDCNDNGAVFTEARVAGDMSSVALSQQTTEGFLQQLLPLSHQRELLPDEIQLSSQVILAVQINYFDCGGIAVAVCIWHEIADASTLASFVKIWAEIARGEENVDHDNLVVIDNSSIFVPQDMTSPLVPRFVKKPARVTDSLTMKKLVFHSSKIDDCLQKLQKTTTTGFDHSSFRPTRFEALSALLWGAYAVITTSEVEQDNVNVLGSGSVAVELLIAVDLRKRLNPNLPKCSIGNISQSSLAFWPIDAGCPADHDHYTTEYYHLLAKRIRETTKVFTDEHIREFHRDGRLYKFLIEIGKNGKKEMRMFSVSSWCRFPFYDTDFGWGKPVWICPALRLQNACIMVDSKDGEGIEAWVALSKEDMKKFLQNPDIVAYASFSPTM